VWVQIEEGNCADDDDLYENIGEPHQIGEFVTLAEAEDFVDGIECFELVV
jgi:hypothetical protein